MANNLLEAIFTLVSSNAGLMSQIGSYNFGSGNVPAVFTVDPAPADAAGPLIVITQTGGSLAGRDRSHRGGIFELTLTVWGKRNGSTKATYEIAMDVWRLIDRAVLTVQGYDVPMCLCDPPAFVDDPEGYPGYSCSARILMREDLDASS